MASNPMQKKARISFLLGMVVMLLISGIVIVLLFMQLANMKNKENEQAKTKVKVFVLNQNVSTGQVITNDMYEIRQVDKNLVPDNAISDDVVLEDYKLKDKEGNDILTKYDTDKNPALFVKKGDLTCQLKKEANTDNYYLEKTNEGYYVYLTTGNEEETDDKTEKTSSEKNQRITAHIKMGNNVYNLVTANDNKTVYLKYDKEGNNIYYTLTDNSKEEEIDLGKQEILYKYSKTGQEDKEVAMQQIEKQYIELTSVPLVAKVSMKSNTVITKEFINKSDNIITDDVRRQEYNMFVLPMDLTTGDYVDVRLMLPSGQDYIVVSKKEVEIPLIGDEESENTVWMNLREDEILSLSSAIVDAARINGSKLYITKYAEAGLQNAAIPTYMVNRETAQLIQNNPDIIEKAKQELLSRYNLTLRNEYINKELENAGEEGESRLQTQIQQSITNSQESRKEYLDSLAGAVE